MNQMIDYGGYCEYASQNAYNIDEEVVPLVVRCDVEHGHRVSLISISYEKYLK